MAIELLSNETIDKIAAGEVVEKPLNVVKELVENSIDAGSASITIEIKGGGTELIRVTDNGSGISKEQCAIAFLRHATSKIKTIEDLDSLMSLGFRGEALSSISAVSKTEMITKTKGSLLGTRVCVEGGKLLENSDIGAPDGTTIVVRSLFFNTPARKKFLKTPTTEGALIEDIVEKFALSNPQISFQFILNGKTKISTSGNGKLDDVIYHIYGKDIYKKLLPVDFNENGIKITGFVSSPDFSYQARNGELYFVNGRYVKSKIINTAIEEVYRNYLMQHRFPFCVLYIDVSPDTIDVNVHPQKLDVKFSDNELISDCVINALESAFKGKELIPEESVSLKAFAPEGENLTVAKADTSNQSSLVKPDNAKDYSRIEEKDAANKCDTPDGSCSIDVKDRIIFEEVFISPSDSEKAPKSRIPEPFETSRKENYVFEEAPKFVQETLFEKKLISDAPLKEYRIIGQVFDTYWLITLDNDLYIVDQHAAHEKVNYERLVKMYNESSIEPGQMLLPPLVIHLSSIEEETLLKYMPVFEKTGFEIEEFGIGSYAIRAVPINLYGVNEEELFHGLLNELIDKEGVFKPQLVHEKLASMSCKAAIKGGQRITFLEMSNLMKQLMTLENPYNCPHGRPVFIKITKQELEKKFKRIV